MEVRIALCSVTLQLDVKKIRLLDTYTVYKSVDFQRKLPFISLKYLRADSTISMGTKGARNQRTIAGRAHQSDSLTARNYAYCGVEKGGFYVDSEKNWGRHRARLRFDLGVGRGRAGDENLGFGRWRRRQSL